MAFYLQKINLRNELKFEMECDDSNTDAMGSTRVTKLLQLIKWLSVLFHSNHCYLFSFVLPMPNKVFPKRNYIGAVGK